MVRSDELIRGERMREKMVGAEKITVEICEILDQGTGPSGVDGDDLPAASTN